MVWWFEGCLSLKKAIFIFLAELKLLLIKKFCLRCELGLPNNGVFYLPNRYCQYLPRFVDPLIFQYQPMFSEWTKNQVASLH